MKIISIESWKQDFKMKEGYTIAYEQIETCSNVFLRLTTNTGLTGWGCAAPDLEVTGETAIMVMDDLSRIIEPILKNEDPFRLAHILEMLKKKLPKSPSASTMVDMALYDLLAKKAGLPLYKLLGGYRHSIPTSITIGILPLDETLIKAKSFFQQGFLNLKLKGGKNVEEDIEKVIKIREVLGSSVNIRFDANQGYSVENAVYFISKTKTAVIEILEQPTVRKNDELLKEVTGRVHVPVMVDEGLKTLADVFRLTSNECTDMINIKLMKVGGIFESLHINSVAKAAGVEAMVGCLDESELGIAAGLHFALARPNIIYADLDGHLDLIDDPFSGLFRIEKGIMYPNEFAGLGVDENKLVI